MSVIAELLRNWKPTGPSSRRRKGAIFRQTVALLQPTETLEVRQLLTGDLDWVMGFSAANQNSFASVTDVVVDRNNNLTVVGTFRGTVDFDPGIGRQELTDGGPNNVFICQYNSDRTLNWVRHLSGEFVGLPALAVSNIGMVVVRGGFIGEADLDPGTGVAMRGEPGGGFTSFVMQLGQAGNLAWVVAIDSHEQANFGLAQEKAYGDVCVMPNGDVVAVGHFDQQFFVPRGDGISDGISPGVSSPNDSSAYVLRLNASGKFVSAGRVVPEEGAKVRLLSVAPVADGSVVVGGRIEGSVLYGLHFGGTPRENLDLVGQLQSVGFGGLVGKFSADGGGEWLVATDGGYTNFTSVAADANGRVVAGGTFAGTVDFDPGVGTLRKSAVNSGDACVLTLNHDGTFERVTTFGGANDDTVEKIAVDGEGGIYLTGYFGGTMDLDPGPGRELIRSTPVTFINGYVSKLNADGSLAWGHKVVEGETSFAAGGGLAVGSDGAIYLGGGVSDPAGADFDPQPGRTVQLHGDVDSGFLSRMLPDMMIETPENGEWETQLRRNESHLETWVRPADGGGDFTLSERHRLSGIRRAQINGNAENGIVGLDFKSGGHFSVPGGILVNGNGGPLDTVAINGNNNEAVTYKSSGKSGDILEIPGGLVLLQSIPGITISNVQHMIVQPQSNADAVFIAPPGGEDSPTLAITGTTDGQQMAVLQTFNVRDLTIDTGAGDAVLARSNDVVTFAASSLQVPGLKNVFVRTGRGNDVLVVNGPDIGLRADDGKFWFIGGAGADRISAIGDANWDLNGHRLLSGSGGQIQLSDIERATIIGGDSANHLSAVNFPGDVILDGGAGNDLLRGGIGNDVMFGGTGNDRLLGGIGNDRLHGQDGNDQIWGDAGEDTIYGNAGRDRLWGGDDNDWMSGDAGEDELYGDAGDDVLQGGDHNDHLFGDAGRDTLFGGNHDDFLSGGADNDTLNGQAGVDLYELQGTNNAEDLSLSRASISTASFRRRMRGLASVLELDMITMDAHDEFGILALNGDDLISIDEAFTQLGSVDGGNGTDSCTAPSGWTKVSC